MNRILLKCIVLVSCFYLYFGSQSIYAQSSAQLYNQVQNIYISGTSTNSSNCSQAKSYIAKLAGYKGYRQAVPANKAYSVNFPNKVNNPTIGDLAKDRIARLESRFKSCLTTAGSPRSVELYNKVQNMYGRYYNISSSDCNRVNTLINDLSAYKNYTERVPADKAYSVSFKRRVTNPTIGDLAEDRVARVQSRFKNCVNSGNYFSQQRYNTVQNIYLTAPRKQSLTTAECNSITGVISKLEPYLSSKDLIPNKWTYTVIYPNKKVNPTIADLARDRIQRLKMLSSSCVRSPQMSNYVLSNLPGIYNYNHKGRKFQLTIYRNNNDLSAAYTKHEYSYPPVYEGVELITSNMVRFKFVLGGTYRVELEVAHNSMGVSAYIYESWEGTSKTNLGVISSNGSTNITSSDQSVDGSVKVTFTNSTGAAVQIYWINFQGVEVKYYDLPSGRSYTQSTYNTHKWRIRQGGSVLLNYAANNYKSQAVNIR
ncbi:hypothetical protein [Ascidiimonas sp. W6]|uniref:VHL beta domain-containing protein n=1 Tax=Ascidiimonas meishanensis TaxID=3128903 RepID=UPI0030EB43BB